MKASKRIVAGALFFVTAISGCFALILCGNSPEQQIIGKWKEASWKYEKVNHTKGKNTLPAKEITADAKSRIASELIIHEAETWEFRPDGKLLLHKRSGKPTVLGWKLKGRGHILKLHYRNEQTEFYDLAELSGGEMVLFIDVEIQAKGIVRMTFRKIT